MPEVRVRVLAILVCAACAGSASVLRADSPAKTGAGVSFDEYRVIAEQNIYLKDRRQATRPPGRFASILRPEPPPPSPEENIVLTGIVRHGDEYVAFFEDRRSGATLRVRRGQVLLGGSVGTISLDFVEYIRSGQVARIDIGENLAKRASGPAAAPTVAQQTEGETAVAPARPAASGDEASILEMLRKRRQQEMGNN